MQLKKKKDFEWERHLAGFPHLGVVDRWPATPKRARIAH